MADKRVIEQTASTELYNDDWFLKDSVVEGTTKISAAKLKELLGADGTQALEEIANAIAEEYDSTHTYSLNDWVFHEGTLYRCIGNNVTGTWNATKWQARTIKEFIDTAKNSVLSTIEQMLGEYLPISTLDPPSIEAISKGDIFIYQQTNRYKFYRAKADHPQGVTEFDIDDWDEFDTVSDLIEDVTENAGKVADVQVKTTGDYETVVENKIAKIDLSSVTAYGEVPNLPQAIATFKDGADAPMKSLKVAIEPVQDLHGYDSPWAGGAGKNKLSLTVDRIKSDNTSGSWSGNTYSINGAEYKINTDNAGNVISISARNLASNPNGDLRLVFTLSSGSYILSSGFTETNGTNDSYLQKNGVTIARGNNSSPGPNFTLDSSSEVVYHLRLSKSGDSSYIAYPMIRLASVSDATFAPYSNICPISGWSEANVTRTGKNLFDNSSFKFVKGYFDSNGNWNGETTIYEYPTDSMSWWSSIIIDITKFKNDTITYSGFISSGGTYRGLIDENFNLLYNLGNSSVASGTINLANYPTAKYLSLAIMRDDYSVASAQLEIGTTATSYEPYNGNTYTIDLDGTRYGGELDVVSGIMTVKRVGVDMATLNWTNSSSNHRSYCYDIKNLIKIPSSQSAMSGCIAEKYFEIPSTGSLIDGKFAVAQNGDLIFYYDGVNSPSGKLVYPLATPLTIQLTPTQVKSLLGSNNVWADTGDIDKAEYQRDATTIINELIARIEALEG